MPFPKMTVTVQSNDEKGVTIRVEHDIHQSYSRAVMPAAERLARQHINVPRALMEGWYRLALTTVEKGEVVEPRTLSDVRYEYGGCK